MYAFVQYVCDSTTVIIHCSEIEGFNPKNAADFDASEIHQAYWRGDEDTEGGFYSARILHLTATWTVKESAQGGPKKCEEELLNEMGGSALDMVPRSTPQQRLQALEAEMEILKEQVERNKEPTADPSCSSNPQQPSGSICRCTTEPYEALQQEVQELRSLNKELKKNLGSEDFFQLELLFLTEPL
ncbi:hypothetical protein MTO96_032347 [Rhipicephalus appendiculatus]